MRKANTELKLKSAFQRRNLAMDLAGLASFEAAEGWTQLSFSFLLRDPPRGFAIVSRQQLLDTDRRLITMASHKTIGNLLEALDKTRPLDEAIVTLKEGSAGERCARGLHECYKKGCFRAKPYYLCTHTD